MKYQLLDKSNNNFGNKKGEFYLELMRLEIAENDKNRKQQWKQLQDSFLGELPNNGPAKPDTPTIEQWSDNHENSGWRVVESGICRSPDKVKTNPMLIKLSVNKIPKYKFELHNYSDFKYEFESWFNERNQDIIWKSQINIISHHTFNFNYLELDSLSYNEMLFILLGFRPEALKIDVFFFGFKMLGYRKNTFKDCLGEWLMQNAPEADLLYQKLDFQQERVETSKFIDWAESKGLLIKLGKRLLPLEIVEILHKSLINKGYIDSCHIYEIWKWKKTSTLLRFLIVELRNNGIIQNELNPFDVIEPYIVKEGGYNIKNKGYGFDKLPAGNQIISSIVGQLTQVQLSI